MTIVKSRGGMVAMLAVMAFASVTAMAQAPAGGPPRGMGGGMGMGMGAADRPTTIQRQGLDDPALNLTAAQKAQIDKIVDAYIVEQKALGEKYPMAQGAPPSQEGMAARMTSRENFNTALGKVLDDSQKKTWDAARAARRPPGGGMGGGAGGPPPAR